MPTDDDTKHSHSHAHGEDHDHDEVDFDGEEEDDGIVVFTDADGNEVAYMIVDIIDVEDEQYALLTPATDEDEDESDTDEAEIFIFHYEVDEDGAESFSPVEDEAVFAKVREAAMAIFTGEDDA